MMAKLPREHLERGVIDLHICRKLVPWVALSAQRLGCNAMIVGIMLSIFYTCFIFVLVKILIIEDMILYVCKLSGRDLRD